MPYWFTRTAGALAGDLPFDGRPLDEIAVFDFLELDGLVLVAIRR
jgi:hypothetical protein